MNDNQTNLLPISAVRKLRREYLLRLATVAAALGLALLAAHAVLLIPTYFYSNANAAAKQTELDLLTASRATAEERAVADRLSQLRADAARLTRVAALSTGSGLVREMLAIPRPGIRLTGFAVTRGEGETPSVMKVSGVARTRDSLRAYVSALEAAPSVSAAEIPISAYAKESDIPFTVSITLKP